MQLTGTGPIFWTAEFLKKVIYFSTKFEFGSSQDQPLDGTNGNFDSIY